MKANYYRAMNKTEAFKIAQKEVSAKYDEIFADCAADVMQQTLANVLLCLERDYNFGKKRLSDFVKALQGWCDIMDSPTELTKGWTTNDNIKYFREKYGIDLKKEFSAEVRK